MLYTLPYNNSDPETFLESFEPYKANIHSFYFSFPGLFLTHNPTRDSAEERLGKDTNTYRFLEMINRRYKSVLCINTLVYPGDLKEITYKIIREMTVLVEQFGLTAVNVASPTLVTSRWSTFRPPAIRIPTSRICIASGMKSSALQCSTCHAKPFARRGYSTSLGKPDSFRNVS